jgi:hypothetical protein
VYLFVLYAAAIWFGVHYFRRRWPAVVVLLVTIPVALGGVALLRSLLGTQNGILSIAAVAYESLILMVGVLIVLLPRGKKGALPCPRCRYDLTGNTSGTCPECGRRHDLETRVRHVAHRRRVGPREETPSDDSRIGDS